MMSRKSVTRGQGGPCSFASTRTRAAKRGPSVARQTCAAKRRAALRARAGAWCSRALSLVQPPSPRFLPGSVSRLSVAVRSVAVAAERPRHARQWVRGVKRKSGAPFSPSKGAPSAVPSPVRFGRPLLQRDGYLPLPRRGRGAWRRAARSVMVRCGAVRQGAAVREARPVPREGARAGWMLAPVCSSQSHRPARVEASSASAAKICVGACAWRPGACVHVRACLSCACAHAARGTCVWSNAVPVLCERARAFARACVHHMRAGGRR